MLPFRVKLTINQYMLHEHAFSSAFEFDPYCDTWFQNTNAVIVKLVSLRRHSKTSLTNGRLHQGSSHLLYKGYGHKAASLLSNTYKH